MAGEYRQHRAHQSTGKRPFNTVTQAHLALATIWNFADPAVKVPLSAYECRLCSNWFLTSKAGVS